MKHILLVHGAWHGAWCWYKTVPALAKLGITAHTIDLPGHGLRLGEAQTLAAYADAVAETLATLPGPTALLGHSMGGQVIGAAAELAPERISVAISLAGFLPKHGETILDQIAGDEEAILGSVMHPLGDGRFTVADEGIVPTFYADCPKEDVALARMLLVPQSGEPFGTPVTQTAERAGTVRRGFILCTGDKALGPMKQRDWAERSGVSPVVLEASHSPFFSAPDKLAAAIESLL